MSKAFNIARNLGAYQSAFDSSGDLTAPNITTDSISAANNVNVGNINVSSSNHTWTLKGIDAPIGDSQTGTAPDTTDNDSGQLAIYNGATKLWGITEHGWIQNPNRPAFHAWGYASGESSSQSWSGTAAYQTLELSNLLALNNNDNNYDSSLWRYTIPISGMYVFMIKITPTSAASGPSCTLHKNGSGWGHEMLISYDAGYSSTFGIIMGYVYAGDYLEAKVINYNNSTFTIEKWRSSFSGYLLA